MPNLKIFVDEAIGLQARARLHAALPSLRDLLCRKLDVDLALAQFALVPVLGLSDQAQLAVEMQILPKPQRTREHLVATCELLRDTLRAIVDVKTAIRVTTVDPENYLVLR
jgi:hypothetical protein